ncbi:hypothetical protein HanHA300_Chr05g0160051 [Helianthus annuus]|nr:hypothetical protein HanHA300_Chr05g0160051 [Helianthus annuus]KAJ0745928.1 hypothetical protein HanOQP8_Chr05g0171751 [Helianthus annuus]
MNTPRCYTTYLILTVACKVVNYCISVFLGFYPCKVELKDSVEARDEPKTFWNFVKFSLQYVVRENIQSHANHITPRFGGHQTLEEREQSFRAVNQTIHCGFVEGFDGSPNTGFDLDNEDKMYMYTCTIVVSSCIFGSSDFLRRPTSKMVLIIFHFMIVGLTCSVKGVLNAYTQSGKDRIAL